MTKTTTALIAGTRKSNPCNRCGGTGEYVWGTIHNGVASHRGPCFRCAGNGIDPKAISHEEAEANIAAADRAAARRAEIASEKAQAAEEARIAAAKKYRRMHPADLADALQNLDEATDEMIAEGDEAILSTARVTFAMMIREIGTTNTFYAPNVWALMIERIDEALAK